MQIRARHLPLLAACATILALAALLGRVGSDARWLAALGQLVTSHGNIPAGIPFAAAGTAHWPNVPVLAELIFGLLERAFGDRGLVLAQLFAVAAAGAILVGDARRAGGDSRSTAWALAIGGLGALPSLAIARVQMFSLVLFPLLVVLLRAETRRRSARIWLVLPLLALWSNLHGAALLGLVTVLAYLVLERFRHDRALALALCALAPLSLCLTPALADTVRYYHGLIGNVAAGTGQGMWAPLSLGAPLDVLLVLCALALLHRCLRRRPPWWELAVVAILAAGTVGAARDGVWLLFLLVPPAAAARAADSTNARRSFAPLATGATVTAAVLLVFALVRGPVIQGATPALVRQAVALAHGTPVLAGDGVDEQVALAHGRIWIGNPIDAFSHHDQTVYLDWLAGRASGRAALSASDAHVVVVAQDSTTQALVSHTPGFRRIDGDGRDVIYVRS